MNKNDRFLIVGLGLLGGKYAQVLSQKGYRVTGITHSQSTLDYALEHAYICEGRNENFDDLVQNADYIIFGLYPAVLLEWVKQYGHLVRPGTLVTDVSGVKRGVVEPVQQMLPEGVEFIASHPMAGKEQNGFAASDADLFDGASYILVPCGAPQRAVDTLKALAIELGFGGTVVTTPEHHDTMIAYTSQLPHVLACAYVMSPCCPQHNGFSAGSYRDVSRVARINEVLWTELFLDNADALTGELDILIDNITRISEAVKQRDADALRGLLRQGRLIKERLGE